MIRILIVDDQRSIREVLRVMLDIDAEMQVVGTASDGYTAIEQVELLQPDLVLIDIEMPGLNGFEATQQICQKVPGVKVLILSMHKSDDYVSQSLEAGAIGYLVKNTPSRELRESIRLIFKEDVEGSPEEASPWWTEEPIPEPLSANAQGTTFSFELPFSANAPSVATPKRTIPGLFPDREMPKVPWRSPPAQLPAASPQAKPISPLLYAGAGLLSVGLIWVLSLFYILKSPKQYTSQWTVSLPATASSARVDLPGIGETTTESDSPYSSQSFDPRETYKTLATTDEVVDFAAQQIGMAPKKFGSPKVQIVLNTTLMQFQISGATPQEARNKGVVLHQAFEHRLGQLRKQEVNQTDQGLEESLGDARRKLAIARQRLTDFQTSTGLNSSEQLRDLAQSTEQLRRQQAENSAQLQEVQARSSRLSSAVGLGVNEVADAFALDADALFQQYVADYSRASAEVVNLRSQLSENHPTVLDRVDAQRQAQSALLSHAQAILGRPVTLASVRKLSLRSGLNASANREPQFQELISLNTQERGLNQQIEELKRQINQQEQKLKTLSGQNATLVKLERDVTIAEAVFSSTLTRQDLSQSTISASYPPIALITQPTLPKEASSPKVKFALLGSGLGSILIVTGCLTLWWRDRRADNAKKLNLPH